MKITTEIYASIDEKKLIEILNNNKPLTDFVNNELDRMRDEGLLQNCCSSSCCCPNKRLHDTAFLTSALASIFNYYIPDEIKNAINMAASTTIESNND